MLKFMQRLPSGYFVNVKFLKLLQPCNNLLAPGAGQLLGVY
jgi:hypothetical protein